MVVGLILGALIGNTRQTNILRHEVDSPDLRWPLAAAVRVHLGDTPLSRSSAVSMLRQGTSACFAGIRSAATLYTPDCRYKILFRLWIILVRLREHTNKGSKGSGYSLSNAGDACVFVSKLSKPP